MNKKVYIFLSLGLLIACNSEIDSDDAFAVAGSYQFTEYQAPGKADENPTGDVIIKQLDNQRVNIQVKGVAGNNKVTYLYPTVIVVSLARDQYILQVKGRTIGEAGNDGVSRYVTIKPTSSITIKAIEF